MKCEVEVAQLYLMLFDLMDHSLPGSSVHGDSPGKDTGMVSHALLHGNLPNPGTEPRSPALQTDSLPSEPPGKPQTNINMMHWLGFEPRSPTVGGNNSTTEPPMQALPYQSSNFGRSDSVVTYSEKCSQTVNKSGSFAAQMLRNEWMG